MSIGLQEPGHFAGLAFTNVAPDGPDGRFVLTAPCGCKIFCRRVVGGPLAGHTYGDRRYLTCTSHGGDETEGGITRGSRTPDDGRY